MAQCLFHFFTNCINEWMFFRQTVVVLALLFLAKCSFAPSLPLSLYLYLSFDSFYQHFNRYKHIICVCRNVCTKIRTQSEWNRLDGVAWAHEYRSRIFISFHSILHGISTVMNWISRWLIHDCDTHTHTNTPNMPSRAYTFASNI